MIFIRMNYVFSIIKDKVLRSIYDYEPLSEMNKEHILKLFNLLLENLGEINQKDCRIIIRTNKFTNNKSFTLLFWHGSKKVKFKVCNSLYTLNYDGKKANFTEKSKDLFMDYWYKLSKNSGYILNA